MPINPHNLLTLSAVQLEASRLLSFDPRDTLRLLLELHEYGVITQPRTGSTGLTPATAAAMLKAVEKYLPANGGLTAESGELLDRVVEAAGAVHAKLEAIVPIGTRPTALSGNQAQLLQLISAHTVDWCRQQVMRATQPVAALVLNVGCGTLQLVHNRLVWRDRDGRLLFRSTPAEAHEAISHASRMLLTKRAFRSKPGARLRFSFGVARGECQLVIGWVSGQKLQDRLALSGHDLARLRARLRDVDAGVKLLV